jgi:ribose transport system permease protein
VPRSRGPASAVGHLRYLLETGAVIGRVGIGQSFVVISGGIDLSIPAIVTISAVVVPLVAFVFDIRGFSCGLVVLGMNGQG